MKIRHIAIFLLTIFCTQSSFANGILRGGGGTVPWPWPWADECPIDFESLRGMWVMGDGKDESFILIDSRWREDMEHHYVAIQLINHNMEAYGSGYAFVDKSDRTIEVDLENLNGGYMGSFELKIYHRNHVNSCKSRELVPIAMIKMHTPDNPDVQSHYVLKPRTPNAPEEKP